MLFRITVHTDEGRILYLKAVGAPLTDNVVKAGKWPRSTASAIAKMIRARPHVTHTQLEEAR